MNQFSHPVNEKLQWSFLDPWLYYVLQFIIRKMNSSNPHRRLQAVYSDEIVYWSTVNAVCVIKFVHRELEDLMPCDFLFFSNLKRDLKGIYITRIMKWRTQWSRGSPGKTVGILYWPDEKTGLQLGEMCSCK